MNKNQEKPNTSLKDSVIGTIKDENIIPKERWRFCCWNYFVWCLWFVSVLVGAVSIGLLLYVFSAMRYELFEATHETFLSYLISVLPYVWIVALIGMVVLAYVNMRATSTGYRYALSTVLISSIGLSLFGGILIHGLGTGYVIERIIDRTVPMYQSLEDKERMLWQQPEEGRLIGFSGLEQPTAESKQFIDGTGRTWNLNTEDLQQADVEVLNLGTEARVIGFVKDQKEGIFHACGVFQWMYDDHDMLKTAISERRDFVERMYAHKDNISDRLTALEETTYASTSDRMPMGVCASHASVRRIEANMR